MKGFSDENPSFYAIKVFMSTTELHKARIYCMYVHVCVTVVCMERTLQILSYLSCKKEGIGGGTVLHMFKMTVTGMKWGARPHHQYTSIEPVHATIGRCTHLGDMNPSDQSDPWLGRGATGNPAELMEYSASSPFGRVSGDMGE